MGLLHSRVNYIYVISLPWQKWAYGVIDDRCCTCYGAQPRGPDGTDEADVEEVEHEADVRDVLDEQTEAVRR